jgi:hypothetical protein
MDTDDNDDPEPSYRRGSTHGAWDVIRALSPRLSAAERARLGEWFGEARVWRSAAIHGERKSEGNLPPREGLTKVLSN